MAKKETNKRTTRTTAGTKTAHNEAARKVAKDIFGIHEELAEIFVTSDGTAFSAMCDARNHARTLKNSDIIPVKRGDLSEEAEEVEKTDNPDEGTDGAQNEEKNDDNPDEGADGAQDGGDNNDDKE